MQAASQISSTTIASRRALVRTGSSGRAGIGGRREEGEPGGRRQYNLLREAAANRSQETGIRSQGTGDRRQREETTNVLFLFSVLCSLSSVPSPPNPPALRCVGHQVHCRNSGG